MFSLANEPINIDALHARLKEERAGAVATFEGRVRNHNEGRQVKLLEYEAYGELAVKEAQRIMEEAKKRFAIYECLCVHRTGALKIGDVAVYVAVTAAHRDAAFDACRFIIDEIKHRVPIFKKEHYDNGDTGWVNCSHPHLHKQEEPQELDILDLSSAELAKFAIVDIREPGEDSARLLKSLLRGEVLEIPLSKFDLDKPPLQTGKSYLFVCQKGARSSKLVSSLRQRGFENTFCLAGGVEAVRRKFIA